MMTFAWYFWPAIWSAIGVGAAVTAALCLAIASAPGPRLGLRGHALSAPRSHRRGFQLAHHARA